MLSHPRQGHAGGGLHPGAARDCFLGLTVFAILAPGLVARAASPSFRHDVMPILSKSGCNTGACHGSAGGKGKLKLSLRGESPEEDFATLTTHRTGRRLHVEQPERSALLRKPAELVEHEGGRRFGADSEAFRILRDWIAAGAVPDPSDAPALSRLTVEPAGGLLVEPVRTAPLKATAHFSDGSSRDVTRWAVYEPSNLLVTVSPDGVVQAGAPGDTTVVVRFEHLQTPVRLAFIPDRPPLRSAGPPPRNRVDEAVFELLRERRLPASPVCDDATFARRAWLDLTGRLPSAAEARDFAADPSPDKRD
ncbi:MAG: DUF1549 domain-containing protein, partial [Verrucomicrobia bacterium]|nr:DUF1549 domain-containing protein [Verrucomicrobiota bacterium]